MKAELTERLIAGATHPVTIDTAALAADLNEGENEGASTTARVLSGIGGFFASLLFVLFIFLAELYDNPTTVLFMGVGLVVAAIVLGRSPRQAFLATVIICGYLMGVNLVLIGSADSLSDAQFAVPIFVIAVMTITLTRNYYLVLMAVASLPACLLILALAERSFWFTQAAVLLTSAALLAINFFEHRLLADRRYPAIRSGLVLGLIATLFWYRWGDYFSAYSENGQHDLPTGVGLYLLTIITLFFTLGTRWTVGLGIILLPFTLLPLLMASLLLLLVSYRNQHFFGIASGVGGLLYFTAQYYYDLRWSLLDKSLILMVSGLLLLIGYYLFHQKFLQGEEA